MTEIVQKGLHAYLDGELGLDEAAVVEAQLEGDPDARTEFNIFSLQKIQLGEALDAFGAKPQNFETARLVRQLASAIHRRSGPQEAIGFGA